MISKCCRAELKVEGGETQYYVCSACGEARDPWVIEHVVQYSGGACSFWAAKRVLERFGKDNVVLLFADTLIEDEDNYRFLEESAAYLGAPITRIADGRTPWQVFHAERFIGNSRADPCSKILKRELLDAWVKAHAPAAIRYFGLDWTETDRFERLQVRMEEKGIPAHRIQAPMIQWKPMWDKPDMLVKLAKLGIKPPRLYEMGFAHANCGGWCPKSGQAQFRLLLETMPDRYAQHEREEEALRSYLGKDVAIMRDRRGGQSRPMTMKEFRERIEAGVAHDRHDWGGCGCAID
jgi:3'-phosphoadenosine 5'-phosphosulfate sulfotransferase (PAPS reductase)/FAD synthetase